MWSVVADFQEHALRLVVKVEFFEIVQGMTGSPRRGMLFFKGGSIGACLPFVEPQMMACHHVEWVLSRVQIVKVLDIIVRSSFMVQRIVDHEMLKRMSYVVFPLVPPEMVLSN